MQVTVEDGNKTLCDETRLIYCTFPEYATRSPDFFGNFYVLGPAGIDFERVQYLFVDAVKFGLIGPIQHTNPLIHWDDGFSNAHVQNLGH